MGKWFNKYGGVSVKEFKVKWSLKMIIWVGKRQNKGDDFKKLIKQWCEGWIEGGKGPEIGKYVRKQL